MKSKGMVGFLKQGESPFYWNLEDSLTEKKKQHLRAELPGKGRKSIFQT